MIKWSLLCCIGVCDQLWYGIESIAITSFGLTVQVHVEESHIDKVTYTIQYIGIGTVMVTKHWKESLLNRHDRLVESARFECWTQWFPWLAINIKRELPDISKFSKNLKLQNSKKYHLWGHYGRSTYVK